MLSYPLYRLAHWASAADCSVCLFRRLNALPLVLLLLVVRRLLSRERADEKPPNLATIGDALSLVLLPPLFFPSLLFYTDLHSTLGVRARA